jgi:hypothetical protein
VRRDSHHPLVPRETQQQPEFSGSSIRNHETGYNVFSQPYSPFPTPILQPDYQERSVEEEIRRAFDDAYQLIDEQADFTHQDFLDDARGPLINSATEVLSPELDRQGSLSKNQIGSDEIIKDTSTDQLGGHDADELARTAGELLDHLKHDQSSKFRNSNFLSLMRQLRDREVHVKGDKIVEVSESCLDSVKFSFKLYRSPGT